MRASLLGNKMQSLHDNGGSREGAGPLPALLLNQGPATPTAEQTREVPEECNPISNRRASRDGSMHEGGPYEAPYVRNSALSYGCASVRRHSRSPERPRRPRAEPKYNRRARFNNCATKDTC